MDQHLPAEVPSAASERLGTRRRRWRWLSVVAAALAGFSRQVGVDSLSWVAGIRSPRLSSFRALNGASLARHRVVRSKAGSAETSSQDEDVEDLLDVDGDLEDDWGMGSSDSDSDDFFDDDEMAELKKRFGVSDEVEEAEQVEEGVDRILNSEKMKAVKTELETQPDASVLSEFDEVGSGLAEDKFLPIAMNETLVLQVARVQAATNRFVQLMYSGNKSEVSSEDLQEEFTSGDTVWPASVILGRYLSIQPPPIPLAGKTVVEIGCGLGLPGVLAAKLGAERVLLQDKHFDGLREALETALVEEVTSKITTLRCTWEDLPMKLISKEAALQPFQQPDVFLGSDVLFSEEATEDIARLLQMFLRQPSQAAYLVDPYKRPHRKAFMRNCEALGLSVVEKEIVTWEPNYGNKMETEDDWYTRLLIVRLAL
eukprot:TRINITY_DN27593_c0_g1_i1.p1 TRINITY_DN27593_c0_g1~~TRINITY_DN27593_c0_g1_i1.p1  ORF type:complete len:435 (-),score=88.09 TRINITY_DN27593_c0_g1_i1:121-1401(-)